MTVFINGECEIQVFLPYKRGVKNGAGDYAKMDGIE